MRKVLSFILTIAMLFSMSTAFVFAGTDTATAATMRVAGFDGTVTITNAKGKAVTVKEDLKLLSGYTIKTAKSSYCYISLDDSKAVKIDQNTKVVVEKSGKKIELNIKSGSIYFDVDKKLKSDESMNIKTSNMVTGVRGTSGYISVLRTKNAERTLSAETGVFLLSGSLATVLGNGDAYANIKAGQNMKFGDDIKEIEMPENIAPVIVRAVMEKQVIDSGEMTVAEALGATSIELAAKVTVTDVPESIQQDLAEAVANPEAVDAAIEAAQEQAALEEAAAEQQQKEELAAATEQQAQTTAPQEAQVFADKTIKTETGADAKEAIFNNNTPEQAKPSSGSGNSGNSTPVVLPHYDMLTFTFADGQAEDSFNVSAEINKTTTSMGIVTAAGLFDMLNSLGKTYTAGTVIVDANDEYDWEIYEYSHPLDFEAYELNIDYINNASPASAAGIYFRSGDFSIGSVNLKGKVTLINECTMSFGSMKLDVSSQLINYDTATVGDSVSPGQNAEFTVYGSIFNYSTENTYGYLYVNIPLELYGTLINKGSSIYFYQEVNIHEDGNIENLYEGDSYGYICIEDNTISLAGTLFNEGCIEGYGVPDSETEGFISLQEGATLVTLPGSSIEYGESDDRTGDNNVKYVPYPIISNESGKGKIEVLGGSLIKYGATYPASSAELTELVLGNAAAYITGTQAPNCQSKRKYEEENLIIMTVDYDTPAKAYRPEIMPSGIDMSKIIGHTTTFTSIKYDDDSSNRITWFEAEHDDGTYATNISGQAIVDMFANTTGSPYKVALDFEYIGVPSAELTLTNEGNSDLFFPADSQATVSVYCDPKVNLVFNVNNITLNDAKLTNYTQMNVDGDITLANNSSMTNYTQMNVDGDITLANNSSMTNAGILCVNKQLKLADASTFVNEGAITTNILNAEPLMIEVGKDSTFTQNVSSASIFARIYSDTDKPLLSGQGNIDITKGFIAREGTDKGDQTSNLSYILGVASGSGVVYSKLNALSSPVTAFTFESDKGYLYTCLDGTDSYTEMPVAQMLSSLLYNYEGYYTIQNGENGSFNLFKNGIKHVYEADEIDALVDEISSTDSIVVTFDGTFDMSECYLYFASLNRLKPTKVTITEGSSLTVNIIGFDRIYKYVEIYNYGTLNAASLNFTGTDQKLYNDGTINLSNQENNRLNCTLTDNGTINGIN